MGGVTNTESFNPMNNFMPKMLMVLNKRHLVVLLAEKPRRSDFVAEK